MQEQEDTDVKGKQSQSDNYLLLYDAFTNSAPVTNSLQALFSFFIPEHDVEEAHRSFRSPSHSELYGPTSIFPTKTWNILFETAAGSSRNVKRGGFLCQCLPNQIIPGVHGAIPSIFRWGQLYNISERTKDVHLCSQIHLKFLAIVSYDIAIL